jgi:alpha-D-ribose 1-methylphosphonate 5-triphosphate synthase subunit PhnG
MIQPQHSPSVQGLSRPSWAAALLNVQPDDVIYLAEAIADLFEVRHKRVPKSGLGMMRLRDSVMAQAFNIGEVPMSTAHVELIDTSGKVYEGAANILRDHEALAVAIAICDAALAGGLDLDGKVQRLVDRGLDTMADDSRLRRAMLERSRVSFALMNQDTPAD